jgi:hypothetical protein
MRPGGLSNGRRFVSLAGTLRLAACILCVALGSCVLLGNCAAPHFCPRAVMLTVIF